MPDVNDVRSMMATFRARTAELVRYGEGDPTGDVPVGTVYFDTTTIPPTAWYKKQGGWEKTPPGEVA